jgi:serine phosphatase RsbU (regulator of sigma subunit)
MNEGALVLVEDDPYQLQALAMFLRGALSREVFEAPSVAEGKRILQELGPRVDVVITDMLFGSDNRDSGLEVVDFARNEFGECPPEVIVTTAHGNQSNAVRAMEFGAFTYVDKGRLGDIYNKLLIEKVRRAIEAKTIKDELHRQRQRIRGELEQARMFQISLLPPAHAESGQWIVRSYFKPCEELSGDFIDVQAGKSGDFSCTIGDVVGHGVKAALLGAMIQLSVRRSCEEDSDPSSVAESLRGMSFFRVPDFCTIMHFQLQGGGRVKYFSAGHPDAIIVTGAGCSRVRATGAAIIPGLPGLPSLSCRELALSCGAKLVAVTDGVLEAVNLQGDEFGLGRLSLLLESSVADSPEVVVARIVGAVEHHVGEGRMADDVSILVMQAGVGAPTDPSLQRAHR